MTQIRLRWLFPAFFWAASTALADACPRPALEAPRPVPAAAKGEVAIATQNLWRLFDDVDNGPASTTASNPGKSSDKSAGNGLSDAVPTAEYQRRLDKWAAQVVDVLRAPAVIAVQEAENIAVLQALAARITARGGPRYRAELIEGADIGGIDVGYLVAPPWQLVSIEPLLDSRRRGPTPLFDRPPLHLQLQAADGRRLELVNVHLKSLHGSDNPSRADAVRRKRAAQSEALAVWVRAYLTQKPDAPLLLLGDFNATPEILGGVDILGELQAAGLSLLTTRLPPAERYTYVHACRPEAIDHVLAAPALLPVVQRMAVSRGNADGARRWRDLPGPVRASDHDGLVVYLRF
ncbi:MAG: endonuclease/exonuclease/phosphatase family protein [Moraxellaceae bacterium]|nr:endonuclease/exonuclease/phosphatase family protein [Moraxellaceae bacterium]